MRVRAMKNLIYKGEIYEAGAEFEMDDTSSYVQEKRGHVELLNPLTAEEVDVVVADGLPSLEEEVRRKKK